MLPIKSSRRLSHSGSVILNGLLLMSVTAPGARLPAGFTESLVATGLNSATAMAFSPDGRIFLCQQTGEVRIIKNGVLVPHPFVRVQTQPLGERGLLGIAVHPQFATNGWIYIYYTAITPTVHNRITRFTASGDQLAPNGAKNIFELDNLTAATNHNGGGLRFGPDGKLYVGVGENANGANAQTLSNLLGKMLRLNDDGTIPADNPFFSQTSGRNRAIWALGLRNPFTFAFQRGTGKLFINDVGESTWEEIDAGSAGANYGWPLTEGETRDPRFHSPIFVYGHGNSPSTGCAITGGVFYNPIFVRFPREYVDKYFFADLCSGWIRRYDPVTDQATPFATGAWAVVDLRVADGGRLYYLTRNAVWRIDYSGT